ncbi:MAG TPA: STAS domain-containing protein [Pirellulaceae bacterium]|nr:STAS domain-containing protein [Pirellulaceae bacterium]
MSTLLTRNKDGVMVIYLPDVRLIDASRIESLGAELVNLVNKTEQQRFVLNFQNVTHMSSAMIGKLIAFALKCQGAKVALRLCGINDNISKIFKVMKLEGQFQIEADEDTAIASFDKKGWFG